MRRDAVYLRDILDSAAAAQRYVAGLDRNQFLSLSEKQDAVIRCLEVVGEAVRRLSDETKAEMPEIPWERFRRMRNILIHEYDNVDLDLVYATVHRDLPALELAIRAFLDRVDKKNA